MTDLPVTDLPRCSGGRSFPRRLASALIGLFLLTLCASPLLAAGTTTRIEVPIFRHRLPNGDIRFTVPVRVDGGPPIEAMLDTGSFGLRVMARALAPTQYQTTGITRGYGYGSGVVLRGPLATAVVDVGDATTGTPIGIQVVDSVGCTVLRPHCPASLVSLSNYGIGGDGLPREGFDAILGLSLRHVNAPAAAVNPLSAIGSRRWIVMVPVPGATAPGRLIINPDASDLIGFHPVRLQFRPLFAGGPLQVVDSQIPNCPDRALEQQFSCPSVTLDSGARPGVPPFYAYAILYDQDHEAIAVKPR